MYKTGTVTVNKTEFRYFVKLTDEEKISELQILQGHETVARFLDGDWAVKPLDENAKRALDLVLDIYN